MHKCSCNFHFCFIFFHNENRPFAGSKSTEKHNILHNVELQIHYTSFVLNKRNKKRTNRFEQTNHMKLHRNRAYDLWFPDLNNWSLTTPSAKATRKRRNKPIKPQTNLSDSVFLCFLIIVTIFVREQVIIKLNLLHFCVCCGFRAELVGLCVS